MICREIRETLISMADLRYKSFHSRLMPTVSPDKIIGIQVPRLRAYAKTLQDHPDLPEFLQELPHQYYEEDNLQAILIGGIGDYDLCITEVQKFLPFVDNWATCDLLRPRCFKNHREELLKEIRLWLRSEKTYVVRFGLEMLMVHFLKEDFSPEYLHLAAETDSEEYYVNMMEAWYFATALALQWDSTLPYLEQRLLPPIGHRMTIQKALESFRILPERKAYLKTLK